MQDLRVKKIITALIGLILMEVELDTSGYLSAIPGSSARLKAWLS